MSAVEAPNPPDDGVSLEALDFEAERDKQSGSWTRADPEIAAIEQVTPMVWKVYLWGGSSAHLCYLGKQDGEYRGLCYYHVQGTPTLCKGFKHHEGPCAHLCTLRKAEFIGRLSVKEASSTGAIVTDGGRDEVRRDAAGADGQVFGRPEGEL